jgi:radical SAM superfamily enzyme YgiQ (UPF0313 family)
MRILFVNPQCPDTFWSFKYALKFISKKAAFPPLGLLTVAAMVPETWEKRLVDMNVTKLNDEDIKWADYVFLTAMAVQRESAISVINQCNRLGIKIVAGGPLFTSEYTDISGVDHFILNEAEITLPPFIQDIQNGCPQHIYTSEEKPALEQTPLPLWKLVNTRQYSSMSVQYSRGCPFDCEFCDIVFLNGRIPRTKSSPQLIREFEALYKIGWRGSVFIVDDNFIGNKNKLKSDILPAVISWMKQNKYPFTLYTEASINLSDDDDLIKLMIEANFKMVFIGIETPNADSLAECGKIQNKQRDMVESVKKLQVFGLQVQGGFIVGFDSDPHSIFDSMIYFIQKSGIATAMVGLLNAPTGTKLYKRLQKENRIAGTFSGNNTELSTNLIPKMNLNLLLEGYQKIISTIYSPKFYHERIKTFLRNYKPSKFSIPSLNMADLKAFLRSIWTLGIKEKGRTYYWKMLGWTIIHRPRNFSTAVTLLIHGFHFRKISENYISLMQAEKLETAGSHALP